jgi:hypothetical protein
MTATSLLAIDPDVHPACAWFQRGRLVHATCTNTPGGAGLDAIVVEILVYRGAVDGPRMPDLIRMARAGDRAVGHALANAEPACEIFEYTPAEWKGSEPKPMCHVRLWNVLDESEKAILGGDKTRQMIDLALHKGASSRWSQSGGSYYPKAYATADLLDAAALGCVHLGRLAKPSQRRGLT